MLRKLLIISIFATLQNVKNAAQILNVTSDYFADQLQEMSESPARTHRILCKNCVKIGKNDVILMVGTFYAN